MTRLRRSSAVGCAGCKHLRRRCKEDCRFAPYFPASDPMKFVRVHSVYGASNASKILDNVEPEQRAFTVESLVFEANARISNPVHGCIGIMYELKAGIEELQSAIADARNELSGFTGPVAFGPLVPPYALDPEMNEMGQPEAARIVAAEATKEDKLEHMRMSFVQQQQKESQVARIRISEESMNNVLDQHQHASFDQCQIPEDPHMQLHPGQHQHHHLVQQTSAMAT